MYFPLPSLKALSLIIMAVAEQEFIGLSLSLVQRIVIVCCITNWFSLILFVFCIPVNRVEASFFGGTHNVFEMITKEVTDDYFYHQDDLLLLSTATRNDTFVAPYPPPKLVGWPPRNHLTDSGTVIVPILCRSMPFE